MPNVEAPIEAMPQSLHNANAIATRYIYLPEQSRSLFTIFRSSDTAYEERTLEHSLSKSLELVFQERDMSELEGYYLTFFATQKVKSMRNLQRIATKRPSGGEQYNQMRFNESDAFRKKMERADKAFELYGQLAARHDHMDGQAVHDWFVRMRIGGVEVGELIPLPPSIVTKEAVDKAAGDVKRKRPEGPQLDRRELRRLFTLEDMRDPLLDEL